MYGGDDGCQVVSALAFYSANPSLLQILLEKNRNERISGCGAVGRGDASSSNPVDGKMYMYYQQYLSCAVKAKIKKKGSGIFFKRTET